MKGAEFADWIGKASQSIKTLSKMAFEKVEAKVFASPPLAPNVIALLSAQLRRPIPPSLSAFLEFGSSKFEFEYKWYPSEAQAHALECYLGNEPIVWGRGELCNASAFADWLVECRDWANSTWVTEFQEDFVLWSRSFPILQMRNGDFIALDQREVSDDPAVVYLSHDDESRVISPTFTKFLQDWQQLRLIGPESWMIEPFFDSDGFLSSVTEAANVLRDVYTSAAK